MIGIHVHKNGRKMHDAIKEEYDRAVNSDFTWGSFQIFVAGPHNYNETLSVDDKEYIKEFTAKHNIQFVAHGTYLDTPWNGKSGPKYNIGKELEICKDIGANGLVIHLAKKPLTTIIDTIGNLLNHNEDGPILYLEISSAKASKETFETPEKIKTLFGAIVNKYGKDMLNRVGLTIDTAHLWAAGVDIASAENASNWLEPITDMIAKDELRKVMIHLNDQTTERGCGKDQHAPLMYGTIWKEYNPEEGTLPAKDSGLVTFLEFAKKHELVTILERKDDTPKIDGQPLISNILSDYAILNTLGY